MPPRSCRTSTTPATPGCSACTALRVERPEDVGDAWDEALAAGRPALIEFVTDPEVPPLPPHIRFEQAKELAHSIIEGDPAAPRFVKHSVRGKLAEFLTR